MRRDPAGTLDSEGPREFTKWTSIAAEDITAKHFWA
jgi:hypothetical protein